MSVLALSIMPYISASIIIQLMTTVLPELEALKKEGEAGRKVINQYTRYVTVILAPCRLMALRSGWRAISPRPGLCHPSRPVLPFRDDRHPGRRHPVPDVARRADHGARSR